MRLLPVSATQTTTSTGMHRKPRRRPASPRPTEGLCFIPRGPGFIPNGPGFIPNTLHSPTIPPSSPVPSLGPAESTQSSGWAPFPQAAPTPKVVQVPPRLLPAASPAGSPCFPSGSLPATPGSRGAGRAPQVRRGRGRRLAAGRGGGCRSGRGWGRGGGAGSRPPPFAGAAARGRAAAGCG